MRISYFFPPQVITNKDLLFCKYTDHDFLYQKCDRSVDLIYAGSVSVLPQAMKAKEKFNVPIIVWCWDVPFSWREWKMSAEGMAINASRDRTIAKRIKLLRQCDLVISASMWTQKVLREHYDIPSEQIYFFIDIHGIDSIPQQRKEKHIIQISRYYYNKKFESTILAARDLEEYQSILIGRGLDSAYGRELKRYSEKFNSKVLFLNNIKREDVIINLKKATVLTSPSVFEGFGITPVEAIHCNIPILLSDLEVFKEVYGDKALYHRRNDIDDMKEKLECLIGDKALQAKIVRECQPLIAEFTPEKFAKRWERIIR